MAKKTNAILPTRKKKLPAYRSFRISSVIKPDYIHKTSSMRVLWKETWTFLWIHRFNMLKFVTAYTLAYLILVRGVSDFSLDAEGLKEELLDALQGNFGAVVAFITLYSSLLSSVTATSDDVANFFQLAVIVVFSLSFIWLLRKLHIRNSNATVKEAFYQGMRPLIPFLAVLLVMILQLIPAGVGSLIYVAAQSEVVLASDAELLGVTVLAILGLVLTVYLLAGSIFALYIVTLPKMTPTLALRSSMKLLRIHRWVVMRKLIAFFVLLLVLGFILVLPFIIWLPRYAEIAFFVMGCASFAVMHTFMYKLYRSML